MFQKSWKMSLTKDMMSSSCTRSLKLSVFTFWNSMSWLTSWDNRREPRLTVCTVFLVMLCGWESASLSAAPVMMDSGVRNSWATCVKKSIRN